MAEVGLVTREPGRPPTFARLPDQSPQFMDPEMP